MKGSFTYVHKTIYNTVNTIVNNLFLVLFGYTDSKSKSSPTFTKTNTMANCKGLKIKWVGEVGCIILPIPYSLGDEEMEHTIFEKDDPLPVEH